MKPCDIAARITLFLTGLFGAGGIGLSAAANHLDDPRNFSAAATVCLATAPALVALFAARGKMRIAPLAGMIMSLGAILFTADMLSRHFTGMPVFPMAAPTGGMTMIGSWLLVAVAALLPAPKE